MATAEQIALSEIIRGSSALAPILHPSKIVSGKQSFSHIHWIALELGSEDSPEAALYHLTLDRYQIDGASGNIHYLPGELQLVRIESALSPRGPGITVAPGAISLDPGRYYPGLLSKARPLRELSLSVEEAIADPAKFEAFVLRAAEVLRAH